MFALDSRRLYSYERVEPFIECSCGNNTWIKQYRPMTGLTTLYCAKCKKDMQWSQYEKGLSQYILRYGPIF